MKYYFQSVTMGNVVHSLPEVLSQIKESWVHYRTLDIIWKFNPKGY